MLMTFQKEQSIADWLIHWYREYDTVSLKNAKINRINQLQGNVSTLVEVGV